ncbi:MAG: adenylate/guanylate cyclase domain-containing protein [bacterium]
MIKTLSLKSKLVIMFLLISLGCIMFVGFQGIHHGEKVLTERIYKQLTNLRESKRAQLESYYEEIQGKIRALSHNYTSKYAMRELSNAFYRLKENTDTLDDDRLKKLENFYQKTYFPRLTKAVNDKPKLENYLPRNPVGLYLQSQYLSENDHKINEKGKLNKATDDIYYNNLHQHYHPVFHEFIKNNGFSDLFLMDIKDGNIVYSVSKNSDYATNLNYGVYRTSGLAKLYQKILTSQNTDEILGVDFSFYKPAFGAPAMFMGTTIFDVDQRPIGVLAVQISIEKLSNIMTGNQGWLAQGLGNTGEVYLVGKDNLMRSDSRFLFSEENQTSNTNNLKNQTCYTNELLNKALIDKDTAHRICQFNTSILLQPIYNKAVQNALKGMSSTDIVESYTGNKVLAAYSPIIFDKSRWAIIAQMEVKEARIPVVEFKKELGIAAVILASLVTFIAMSLAYLFTHPFKGLMLGVRNLSNGETNIDEELLKRKDEFGQLANTLTTTAQLIANQQQSIEDKERKFHALLLNKYPKKVVRYLEHGNNQYAETLNNVSVIYTTISGFSQYAETLEAEEAIRLLNYMIEGFDQIIEGYEIEKIKTIGDSYLAASGVNISRLDHAKRCVDASIEMLQQVERFNQQHNTHFVLRIGLHSGSVIAGIIGHQRKSYDLWGQTVQVAGRIRFETNHSALIISEQTYERLSDRRLFQEHHQLNTQGMGKIDIWIYKPDNVYYATQSHMDEHINDKMTPTPSRNALTKKEENNTKKEGKSLQAPTEVSS